MILEIKGIPGETLPGKILPGKDLPNATELLLPGGPVPDGFQEPSAGLDARPAGQFLTPEGAAPAPFNPQPLPQDEFVSNAPALPNPAARSLTEPSLTAQEKIQNYQNWLPPEPASARRHPDRLPEPVKTAVLPADGNDAPDPRTSARQARQIMSADSETTQPQTTQPRTSSTETSPGTSTFPSMRPATAPPGEAQDFPAATSPMPEAPSRTAAERPAERPQRLHPESAKPELSGRESLLPVRDPADLPLRPATRNTGHTDDVRPDRPSPADTPDIRTRLEDINSQVASVRQMLNPPPRLPEEPPNEEPGQTTGDARKRSWLPFAIIGGVLILLLMLYLLR